MEVVAAAAEGGGGGGGRGTDDQGGDDGGRGGRGGGGGTAGRATAAADGHDGDHGGPASESAQYHPTGLVLRLREEEGRGGGGGRGREGGADVEEGGGFVGHGSISLLGGMDDDTMMLGGEVGVGFNATRTRSAPVACTILVRAESVPL